MNVTNHSNLVVSYCDRCFGSKTLLWGPSLKGKNKFEGRCIVPCGYKEVTASRGLNVVNSSVLSSSQGYIYCKRLYFLPVQLKPFPEYPELQVQLYDPTVLLQ